MHYTPSSICLLGLVNAINSIQYNWTTQLTPAPHSQAQALPIQLSAQQSCPATLGMQHHVPVYMSIHQKWLHYWNINSLSRAFELLCLIVFV